MEDKKLFTPLFSMLFIENFLFFSSHNSLNMLPPYLSSIGASKGFIGLFMNINPLVMLISLVLFSQIINNLPIKKALSTGFLLQFISLIFMFFFSDNLFILLILRFTAAVSFVFGFTIHANLVFEILPKEKRTGGIAIFGISGILSNPTGSILGETVIHYLEPRYLFLLGAIFCLSALSMLLLWKDQHHKFRVKNDKKFIDMLSKKNLYPLMTIAVIFGGIFSVFSTFIPNFSKERLGFANLSIYFSAFAAIAVLSRLLFSRLMDTTSKNKLLTLALSCMLCAMVLILFLRSPVLLAVIGVAYGFGHSIMFPTMSTAFIENGSEDEKSLLNNSYNVFNTFGNVFLTTLLGTAGDFLGTVSIFMIMAALIVVSIIIAISYRSPGSVRKSIKNNLFSQFFD